MTEAVAVAAAVVEVRQEILVRCWHACIRVNDIVAVGACGRGQWPVVGGGWCRRLAPSDSWSRRQGRICVLVVSEYTF